MPRPSWRGEPFDQQRRRQYRRWPGLYRRSRKLVAHARSQPQRPVQFSPGGASGHGVGGRGRIIGVGSYTANSPLPFNSAFAASKAALLRPTDCVAAEMAGDGVQVFAISPGWAWSDMTCHADSQMCANIPDFNGVDAEFVFPPEAEAKLIQIFASGMADAQSGRMIHVMNELDALIAQADNIVADDRLALRFNLWGQDLF